MASFPDIRHATIEALGNLPKIFASIEGTEVSVFSESSVLTIVNKAFDDLAHGFARYHESLNAFLQKNVQQCADLRTQLTASKLEVIQLQKVMERLKAGFSYNLMPLIGIISIAIGLRHLALTPQFCRESTDENPDPGIDLSQKRKLEVMTCIVAGTALLVLSGIYREWNFHAFLRT